MQEKDRAGDRKTDDWGRGLTSSTTNARMGEKSMPPKAGIRPLKRFR